MAVCPPFTAADQFERFELTGVVLDVLFFGILTVQFYMYYPSFPNDRLILKLTVGLVYLIESAQTGAVIRNLYIVAEWRMVQCTLEDSLGSVGVVMQWYWLTINTSATVVSFIVQCTYAWRLYGLSGRKIWLLLIIVTLSLSQLGVSIFGVLCNYPGVPMPIARSLSASICSEGYGYTWGPLNIACDLIITVSTTYWLLKLRRDTIRRRMHILMTRVIRLVIETGMLATIAMILWCVIQNTGPTKGSIAKWATVVGYPLSKIYSIPMMVLLNNRADITDGRCTQDEAYEMRSSVLLTGFKNKLRAKQEAHASSSFSNIS